MIALKIMKSQQFIRTLLFVKTIHHIVGSLIALICVCSMTSLTQAQTNPYSTEGLLQIPGNSWHTNGGSLFNQRFVQIGQLTPENVNKLKGVWHVNLDGSGVGPQYSGEAQPLVADGVVYIITGADDVFALELATGRRLWKYTAELPSDMTTVCCGWTSRGVGLSEDRVFVGQLDGQLKALNRSTGEVVWAVQAERWQEGHTITAAPLYFDGLVYIGFAGGERGARGRMKAFDAKTGELVWTFYTVPAPGEFGSDTWTADNELWQHGGATIWSTPAVDPELGLLYFGTGNAAADSNGAHRPGDNLFTASILALDLKTGEYRWHFQQVHHDIWDYDAPNPVMLFDLEMEGMPRKGLAQAGKTGWFYLLDRVTGEPLIGIEERPVPQEPRQATALTQPYPEGDAFVPQSMFIAPEGVVLENNGAIFTPYFTEARAVAPGVGGGANWPPSALDPLFGVAYVCALDRPFLYQAVDIDDSKPASGASYTAGVFLGPAMYDFGVAAAIDLRTNKLIWQQHWRDACFSGMTATSTGLLFVGRNDGRLTALASGTGNKLWEFQTGAGMNAPVTIIEQQGRTMILAYAAGNALGGTKKGDNLWLFALDGTLDPAVVSETNNVGETGKLGVLSVNTAEGAADLSNGEITYRQACMTCHGGDGKSGHGGADISQMRDKQYVARIVSLGRNSMPALATILSPEQVRDVAAYVVAGLGN
jgi:quinohemoprotein ethanol dehydrogenase